MKLTVNAPAGIFSGSKELNSYSWKAIPYAAPLYGELRFIPPQPLSSVSSISMSKSFGSICPQKSMLRTRYSEDCLLLNIWTSTKGTRLKPVLFFIHGGAFFHGAGSESYYNGAYLASMWDIVVVTINYRLGVFGFLDFSIINNSFTPNNGIRDVIAALRWVKRNIEAFGGNPDNVTIIGQSAGGTLVSALATMLHNDELYHAAIIMSGGPTQVQSKQVCHKSSEAFLEDSGIESSDQLVRLPLADLVDKQKHFMNAYGMGAATFRVTVDGKLIAYPPIVSELSHRSNTVPLLIGTTKEEMGFMAIKPLARLIDAQNIIDKGLSLEDPALIEQLVVTYEQIYGKQRSLPVFYTDLLFRIASVWLAEASGGNRATWMYRFDYETPLLRMNGVHAFHSTDLPYVFGNFKNVVVRPMFLLMKDMSMPHAVAHEIQKDIVNFMTFHTLDWDRCVADCTPAQCYDSETSIQPMVPLRIKDLFKATIYYRRSISDSIDDVMV
ncbi:MAG: carboxylesterase family protein [Sphaerochaetaceae bacterium]|nr:carboxylesterase family protein [Sphaerochaetaceae bacterium]